MKNKFSFIRLSSFILLFLFACKNEKISQENNKVKIGRFNADSSYQFIEKQVSFGKRYMNTTEHENCKNWLVKKLNDYRFDVIEQTCKRDGI